jgi:hypothetical protein
MSIESLSDIDHARALSRRLTGLAQGGAGGELPGASYVRFDAQQELRLEPRRLSGAPSLPGEPDDMESWDALLDWCLGLTRAVAAFVVDPEGFVLGGRGMIDEDQLEGTGAELSYIMQQVDAINPQAGPLKSMELEFGDLRIVGIRSDMPQARGFVLGFVDSQHISEELSRALFQQLAHSLPELK